MEADVYNPPDDLIQLKAAWYAAQATADAIASETPAGDEEVTITPRTAADQPRTIRLLSGEQNDRLNAARAEVQRLTLEIFRHPWKMQQDDRHKAEAALNEIAEQRWRGQS